MTEATKLELTPDLPDTLDASDYTVEQRDPRSLQPHPQNYRRHPEEQVAEIARNIRDLGLYRPVIIREDGTILAGHGITLACIELGMATIPVYVFGGSEAQARRLLVADNELPRLAEDDDRALAELLKEVSQDYGDLRGTGWDEEKLANFLVVTRSEAEVPGFDAAAEWVGLPEVEEKEREVGVKMIVWFRNETDRDQFMVNNDLVNVVTGDKTRTTPSAWWPTRTDKPVGAQRFEVDARE